MISVFYRPEQNAPQQGPSPPPQKPEHVVRSWQAHGFPLKLRSFPSVTREEFLQQWQREGVEVVLYQAGADPHVDAPFGGHLTTEDLRLRDRTVFQSCARLGLPVAWNLAGDYQQLFGTDAEADFDAATRPVLDLHDNTFRECAAAWCRR